MKAYSEDLRERVVGAVERGTTRCEVVTTFRVSLPTIKRWLRQRRETGTLAPKPIPGPVAVKRDALVEALPERLVEHADATLEEHCSWWRERTGGEVSTATMSRAIAALAWTRKKDHERDRARLGGAPGLGQARRVGRPVGLGLAR